MVKLLYFPLLVRNKIIKEMWLLEAFIISTCSQKMKTAVKSSYATTKYNMIVWIRNTYDFKLIPANSLFIGTDSFLVCPIPNDEERRMEMKIGSSEAIPFQFSLELNAKLTSYWKDPIAGATEVYKQLIDVFKIKFDQLYVYLREIPYDIDVVVEQVSQNFLDVQESNFDGGLIEDRLYEKVIKQWKHPKCLMEWWPSEEFRSPEFRFTEDQNDWSIYNAYWLTIDNFSTMECTDLTLQGCKLSSEDMHLILQNVINGIYPNLEQLSIEVNGVLDVDTVIRGIPNEEEERYITPNPRTVKRMHTVTGETISVSFYEDEEEINEDIWRMEVIVVEQEEDEVEEKQ